MSCSNINNKAWLLRIAILYCLVFFIGCNSANRQGNIQKRKVKIYVEIVPEGDNSYSISWKDTIGQSKGYKLYNRPSEIWCIVKDSKDTTGHYWGQSTPQSFTYFTTKDPIVTVTFLIGPNMFPGQFVNKDEITAGRKITEFNPIIFSTKNDLGKMLEFILVEK